MPIELLLEVLSRARGFWQIAANIEIEAFGPISKEMADAGAGDSIGLSMTFGYRASRHATGKEET